MSFGIGPIKIPTPQDVVNTVKNVASTAADAVGTAVDTATDVAGKVAGELDLTAKATGPLSISKLGLDALGTIAKGTAELAGGAAEKVGDVAENVAEGISDLFTSDPDDTTLHAGGRGRIAGTTSDSGMV